MAVGVRSARGARGAREGERGRGMDEGAKGGGVRPHGWVRAGSPLRWGGTGIYTLFLEL